MRWLAPIPAYVWDWLERSQMRIHPTVSKSVVFVGVVTRGEFTPYGTGFVVRYTDEEVSWHFIVTAAHVFDRLSDDAKKRTAYRVNRRDGTAETIPLDYELRMFHDEKANDISLFPIGCDPTTYDIFTVDIRRAAIEAMRKSSDGVEPGDPVCLVGLYTSHHGRISNVPVVRTGNVAAVPGEPVQTEYGYTPAYLVELRSIAGLSGLPVFQTFHPVTVRDGKVIHREELASGGDIIGVLVGYHRVESKEDQIVVPRFQQASVQDEDAYSRDELNTGFGVVIPIERVCDIFEEEGAVAARNDSKAKHRAKTGYRPA